MEEATRSQERAVREAVAEACAEHESLLSAALSAREVELRAESESARGEMDAAHESAMKEHLKEREGSKRCVDLEAGI